MNQCGYNTQVHEETQGISLCSYLHLKLANMLCFSYYLFFFPTKLVNKRAKQVLPRGGGWEGGGPNNVYTCK
jgi:hypothetical protein